MPAADSRKHQADVSAKLSGQVLGALHALLRGLHAADLRVDAHRIADLARACPHELYGGLLTALMRLVFVLYAEDRGLFPDSAIWTDNYALSKLFDRLRNDAALNPDTMEDRSTARTRTRRGRARGGGPARICAVPQRNDLLDRSFVVDTMQAAGAGFFFGAGEV